ncbi:hypothetical protein ABW20_dc0104329 [Dactylellina cionopaga]|nr:hypothetical protein ABW20_dc0104329 [Dactylellina cionopaga]
MDLPDSQPEPRRFGEPYSTHHPIPSIRGYKELSHNRDKNSSIPGTPVDGTQVNPHHTPPETPTHSNFDSPDENSQESDVVNSQKEQSQSSEGRRRGNSSAQDPMSAVELAGRTAQEHDAESENSNGGKAKNTQPPKKPHLRVREVTDPVTHLPVNIHDFTTEELDQVKQENQSGEQGDQLEEGDEINWSQKRHDSLGALVEEELRQDRQLAKSPFSSPLKTLIFIVTGVFASSIVEHYYTDSTTTGKHKQPISGTFIKLIITLAVGIFANTLLHKFFGGEQPVLHAREQKENDISQRQQPETAAWLNNTLARVWPLVNPDLFVSSKTVPSYRKDTF